MKHHQMSGDGKCRKNYLSLVNLFRINTHTKKTISRAHICSHTNKRNRLFSIKLSRTNSIGCMLTDKTIRTYSIVEQK